MLKDLKNVVDTSDYDGFSKELREYAKLLNSQILKVISSEQNKLLELFNLLNNGSNTKLLKKQMQRIQKLVPIRKKQQIKKQMKLKTFCQNISETLMTNCLKNKVMVKILTVL